MFNERYLVPYILEDLKEKMVFVSGPRQVGKTTLATALVAQHFNNTCYRLWDKRDDRKKLINSVWPGDADLLIIDELHKYKKWKSYIKGEYDSLKAKYRFLVTGSARLDVFRKGGDSLQGRYHYYRLHPFSVAEFSDITAAPTILKEIEIPTKSAKEDFLALNHFGGFPEPLLRQNARTLRRWHNEKHNRLFREDIREVEDVRDLAGIQLLGDMLPERAGSRLSINSLREDLEVSHRAVSNWLNILEAFYYCFRIYPYHAKNYRSLKKEAKLYLWDWSEIQDKGPRFENCLASHLLKLVHFLEDYEGYHCRLHYLRSIEKKEVDFMVMADGKPWFMVEAKLNNIKVSPHIKYFKAKLNVPYAYQVVRKSGIDIFSDGVRVVSADKFLAGLV
ncbi:MAG: AAA family ATPase [Thermodesulfobacteriota bacterium]|nr:AAA family ATPase [Thermodesulfobacteriota bacterium]